MFPASRHGGYSGEQGASLIWGFSSTSRIPEALSARSEMWAVRPDTTSPPQPSLLFTVIFLNSPGQGSLGLSLVKAMLSTQIEWNT